ncbi:minor capsid protein [Lachnospiraceae bacterium OttesenSCG-928-D06]|nr:minor capsid protein [Lachnospiraceae bacterium OttesenSCG-928-D06]
MAETGYVNEAVRAMYGIPYHQLTAGQKRILHADSMRRAKLIEERQQAVILNNLKAFEDEARMEKVLASIYAQCQKDIIADVTETIAKVKKAGGEWSYANQSALTRSRGLFEQITGELNKLGQKEQILFTQGLSNIYTDQFLRQVYTLGQTMPVKANFNRLNPALIQKTLDYPWSGAMFSDRIWQDKATLGRNLRVGLTQSMVLGESIPQIADRINKGIDTSKYNAERLARTETKRVTYCAHDDAYEDMGVEELEYRCANGGDHRTCKICLADNKKHYKRGEEPTLPRHPNCRCVYIPVVSDEFGDNELNELTGSIRGAENYEKWKVEQDEELKKAKLINEAEEKEAELEDAEFNLAYISKSGGDYGNGVYSGLWKEDVTVTDYSLKKDKIQAKRNYFESQLKTTTGTEYDKFNGLLASLDNFEEQGKLYEEQARIVKQLKKELEEAQKKAGIWVDNPFSQERKDNAYWFSTTQDADTVLRVNCGEVWRKASKVEKDALYGYTAGSGSYNRPLTGHAGAWYNSQGINKISIDYEGSGDAIRKMTTALDRSSYDFDIWLQRGCGNGAMDSFFNITGGSFGSMSNADLQKLIGYTGEMTNFISTGVAKGKGFSGDVIMNIYAPKGTKMMYAEPFSHYGNGDKRSWDGKTKQSSFGYESEMIIQRGASYTVTKIERTGYTTYIDVEVHPELGYNKFQQRKYYGE